MPSLTRQTCRLNSHYGGIGEGVFQQRPAGLSKISTRTFYSNDAVVPFFNRTRETKQLAGRVNRKPVLTVLLGPPSTGKTAPVRYVTTQLRVDGSPQFHPLTIDLRSVDTSEEGAFLEAFLDNLNGAGAWAWPTVWNDMISTTTHSSGSLRASLTVWGWIGSPLAAWSQMSRGVTGLSQLS
ncbi:uncharacterized protein PGTG_13713 [Puccinia graminis f. sp. tritici CRL 75-36-700-3]|uniref:Uncharacterized protein n=1 Tax=Puccinia graminis f. sp. tritici (strain CRL 75-36-700-3 / race SCCL) TaxID=418459 RepID=E3KSV5_PUCGT|nr:uncharacterized protein PGTG_13713 [Puccinia graminis f. sp. tritici CRL 75-36-700-3]EFP87485.2 hypothetical protein PGTG_13713 [Puccinia graminis f. sp. tritici CRL 75-36-700-3]